MTTAAKGSLYATGYQAPRGSSAETRSAAGNGSLRRLFACCLAIGTVGLLTPKIIGSQYANATSVAPVHYDSKDAQSDVASSIEPEYSSAQNLARVRKVLKPTMLELANLFGVSRQTVYDWEHGSQPALLTAQRLAKLARVADVFLDEGLSVDARTLRRKGAGGKTLIDAVSSGDDAESVARSLVSALKREALQRERLQLELAGRKRGSPANLSDYGVPALSEDA